MASLMQWTWTWANPGNGEGQGGLTCCSPWGHRESEMTGQLKNNNEICTKCTEIQAYSFNDQYYSKLSRSLLKVKKKKKRKWKKEDWDTMENYDKQEMNKRIWLLNTI